MLGNRGGVNSDIYLWVWKDLKLPVCHINTYKGVSFARNLRAHDAAPAVSSHYAQWWNKPQPVPPSICRKLGDGAEPNSSVFHVFASKCSSGTRPVVSRVYRPGYGSKMIFWYFVLMSTQNQVEKKWSANVNFLREISHHQPKMPPFSENLLYKVNWQSISKNLWMTPAAPGVTHTRDIKQQRNGRLGCPYTEMGTDQVLCSYFRKTRFSVQNRQETFRRPQKPSAVRYFANCCVLLVQSCVVSFYSFVQLTVSKS